MPAKRILVVDDEDLVLESVRMTLVHYGHSVETAASGAEALAKLAKGEFALVVTDLKMPIMSGDEFARQIKQRWPHLPVILLTGFPPETKPPDVDLILLKPFSTSELRSTVSVMIAKDRGLSGNQLSASNPDPKVGG